MAGSSPSSPSCTGTSGVLRNASCPSVLDSSKTDRPSGQLLAGLDSTTYLGRIYSTVAPIYQHQHQHHPQQHPPSEQTERTPHHSHAIGICCRDCPTLLFHPRLSCHSLVESIHLILYLTLPYSNPHLHFRFTCLPFLRFPSRKLQVDCVDTTFAGRCVNIHSYWFWYWYCYAPSSFSTFIATIPTSRRINLPPIHIPPLRRRR